MKAETESDSAHILLERGVRYHSVVVRDLRGSFTRISVSNI